MKIIKSCGFVVYTDVLGERRYLVIESVNGDVGFPKGHVEAGESELETAIRELSEEVGIKAVVTDKSADVSRNAGVKVDAVHGNDTAIGVGALAGEDTVVTDKSADVFENKPFLGDAVVIHGFSRRVEYMLPRSSDAVKQVVYFLAKCFNTDVLKCQESEVRRAVFLAYAEAVNALTFDNTKQILREAENFITSKDFQKENV